jgi:biopolymer transport protein ExbD
MTWSARHAGSPRSVQGLTLAQIIVDLRDGLWEPTDEVMGPEDRAWVPIEAHPQLQAVASEIEQAPPKEQPDETRLDFNALIDVCLVLLILFILTATYTEKKKVVPVPTTPEAAASNVRRVNRGQVKDSMIKVVVRGPEEKGGDPRIWLEYWLSGKQISRPVSKDEFREAVEKAVSDKQVYEMLYDVADVDIGTAIDLQDQAKSARISEVKWVVGQVARKKQ